MEQKVETFKETTSPPKLYWNTVNTPVCLCFTRRQIFCETAVSHDMKPTQWLWPELDVFMSPCLHDFMLFVKRFGEAERMLNATGSSGIDHWCVHTSTQRGTTVSACATNHIKSLSHRGNRSSVAGFRCAAAVDDKFLFCLPEGNSRVSFLGSRTQVLHHKYHVCIFWCFCTTVCKHKVYCGNNNSICPPHSAVHPRWPLSDGCVCVCVCVCWLTACQHSERTHMAGGWDIPARTLQTQTALLSRPAAAFTPGAPAGAQTFTEIPRRLPTRSSRCATRR